MKYLVFLMLFAGLIYSGTFSGHIVDGETGSDLEGVEVTYTPNSGSYLIDTNSGWAGISLYDGADNYAVYYYVNPSDASGWITGTSETLFYEVYEDSYSGTLLSSGSLNVGDSLPTGSYNVDYDSYVLDNNAGGSDYSLTFPYGQAVIASVAGSDYLIHLEDITGSNCQVTIYNDTGAVHSSGNLAVMGFVSFNPGERLTLDAVVSGSQRDDSYCTFTFSPSSFETINPTTNLVNPTYATITGSDGDFTVDNLDALYVFTFSKAGYFPVTLTKNVRSTDAVVWPIDIELSTTFPGGDPGSGPGTISGTIIDSDTGTPIVGATVQLFDGTTLTATDVSDSSGDYTMSVSDDGTYMVSASAPGYASSSTNVIVDLDANPDVTGINLQLDPSAVTTYTFQGDVKEYGTGNLLSGATVQLTYPDGSILTDTTNGLGHYSFNTVSGTYGDIIVSILNYETKSVSVGFINSNKVFQDIYLHPLSTSAIFNGLVTDIDTGLPIEGVTISRAPGGMLGHTDSSGQYSYLLGAGTYDVTYSIVGYESVIHSINVPTSGTVTNNVQLNPVAFGWVFGYVNSFDGATVSVPGYANTTNSSGYYMLYLPVDNYTLTASMPGYDDESASVEVLESIGTEQNFTLSEEDDDDDDDNRSSSSSSRRSSSVTTPPPTTYTTSTTDFSGEGLVVERKIVTVGDDETKVILTITNYGEDVGPFELREHPPNYVKESEIDSYSRDPYEVVSSPLTIVWRFDGLEENGQIVFAYSFDEVYSTMKESHFDGDIYLLKASVPILQLVEDKIIINAPSKGQVGNTVNILVTEEDGEILANHEVLVISPYLNTYSKTTNDAGQFSVTFEVEGVYSFEIPGRELVEEAKTEAVDLLPVDIGQLTDTNISNDNGETPGNFMAMFGDLGIILPALALVFIGIILFLFVGAYAGYLVFGPKSTDSSESVEQNEIGEESDVGEESFVIETGDLED